MLFRSYWPQGVKQIAPVLQCQLDGNYFDSEEFWWPDTWYHITYTYDGSTIRLYKDGTINASKTDSRDFTFNTISLAQSFGWRVQVELAQIRLWSKCLTENAIQEGMSRQISGDSDGLIKGSEENSFYTLKNEIKMNENLFGSFREECTF